MRKINFLLSLLLPLSLLAAERSAKDAAALAAEYMNSQYALTPIRKVSCTATSYILSHTRAKMNSTAPAFYVFNHTDNGGFVVVSADGRTEDILMYSEVGTLDVDNANPNLQFWLNRLQEEISAANDSNAVDKSPARKAALSVTAISPLLTNQNGKEITWYQEAPYYNQCPMDERDNTRCLTGCVATAAAQIMYKWRCPVRGTGSHSYTWYDCKDEYCSQYTKKTLSKDFSQVVFDWDNMLPSYKGKSSTTAQKDAVATLMYCCGVSCDMSYGGDATGGSGAWTDDMGYALNKYFGYKPGTFITTYKKNSYKTAKGAVIADVDCQWSLSVDSITSLFNTELEAGRPILMGGESNASGGHEFVCDGRNTDGKFHINWGWEGDSNCYCKLSALKPTGTGYDFSSQIDAFIGIEPASLDTIHVTGIRIDSTSLTLKQKQKVKLTASIMPADATIKAYTWSSSNNDIASVSPNGQVVGVAAGMAYIIATSQEGNFMDSCLVTVTNEIIETTNCNRYEYSFTSSCQLGTQVLGEYNWNVTCSNASVYMAYEENRGAQLGSRTQVARQISFTTSEVANCLLYSIKVKAAKGIDGDGVLEVYINNIQIGETKSLTTSNTEYSFINEDDIQGNLEIRFTNSQRSLFIKSINLNTDKRPSDLERVNDASISPNPKFILNGQLFIQMDEHLYNAQGQLVR